MDNDRVVDILNGLLNELRNLTVIVEKLNNISIDQQHQINMLRYKVNCLTERVNRIDPDSALIKSVMWSDMEGGDPE